MIPATEKTGLNSVDKLLIPVLLLNLFYNSGFVSHNIFDQINSYRILQKSYSDYGISPENLYNKIYLTKNLVSPEKIHLWKEYDFSKIDEEQSVIFISDLFFGKDMSALLNINEFEGKKYFHKERFEELLSWLLFLSVKELFKNEILNSKEKTDRIKLLYNFFTNISKKAGKSGYRVAVLKLLLMQDNGESMKNMSFDKSKVSQ